jgi:hypothetical protein
MRIGYAVAAPCVTQMKGAHLVLRCLSNQVVLAYALIFHPCKRGQYCLLQLSPRFLVSANEQGSAIHRLRE